MEGAAIVKTEQQRASASQLEATQLNASLYLQNLARELSAARARIAELERRLADAPHARSCPDWWPETDRGNVMPSRCNCWKAEAERGRK